MVITVVKGITAVDGTGGAGGTPITTANIGLYAWALDGNANASARTFGNTTNFDVPVITNNTEMARFGANGFFRLGSGSPSAKLHISGNISTSAWTSNGIAIRQDSGTFTDTTSSGTIGSIYINNLAGGIIAASSTTTYTSAYGLNVLPPAAGTNAILTNIYALRAAGMVRIDGNLSVASGIVPIANLEVGGSISAAAWGANGIGIHLRGVTYTDTSSSGTVALATINSFSTPTIAASSATTYTETATIYIGNAPTNGTNVSSTNSSALYIAAGVLTSLGGRRIATRSVTAAGAITVTTADYYIGANKTVGAATTVNLPANPATGTTFIIADEKLDAATNNITITPAAGNIVGITSATTYVMNTPGQVATIVYNGTFWKVT